MKQYSKTCIKRPHSKRPQSRFQDQLSLNAGQKYCRMLQGEHSAILMTFIKLPFVIKILILSIFEKRFYTEFTAYMYLFILRVSQRGMFGLCQDAAGYTSGSHLCCLSSLTGLSEAIDYIMVGTEKQIP